MLEATIFFTVHTANGICHTSLMTAVSKPV
jgi:hypothetical protein